VQRSSRSRQTAASLLRLVKINYGALAESTRRLLAANPRAPAGTVSPMPRTTIRGGGLAIEMDENLRELAACGHFSSTTAIYTRAAPRPREGLGHSSWLEGGGSATAGATPCAFLTRPRFDGSHGGFRFCGARKEVRFGVCSDRRNGDHTRTRRARDSLPVAHLPGTRSLCGAKHNSTRKSAGYEGGKYFEEETVVRDLSLQVRDSLKHFCRGCNRVGKSRMEAPVWRRVNLMNLRVTFVRIDEGHIKGMFAVGWCFT